MPLPLLGIAALLLAGGGTVVAVQKHNAKKGVGATPGTGHPVQGMPSDGPSAPIGLTAPGIPLPAGAVIALAPIIAPPKGLYDAAAKLLVYLSTMGQKPGVSVDEVKAFQIEFNKTKPPTILLEDGAYSAKTQAALQAVVTPAIAPNAVDATALVALPASPAALPNPALMSDVGTAAKGLLEFLKKNNRKGSFKEVSTMQAAWNSHHANHPLIVDGKYGDGSEKALQSVLNWMGSAEKAPKNVYSSSKIPVPVFIP